MNQLHRAAALIEPTVAPLHQGNKRREQVRTLLREPIALTLTEATLLYLLAANAGSTVNREEIISSIWDGVFEVESNAVDRHIRDLRIKLGDTWPSSNYIETIPGKGYRWRVH